MRFRRSYDEQAEEHAATAEPAEGAHATARISDYTAAERADAAENGREQSADLEQEVEPTQTQEATDPVAVAEEVQIVLASAQEAAAKIRRKAEEEAERVRAQATAEAEAARAEGQRALETNQSDADRVRAEAEAYATETRAEADAAAEGLRAESEREAAAILDEAKRRLEAANAEVAQKIEEAEAEARQRVAMLQTEAERQEERLQSILVVLRGMSSQLSDLLGGTAENDDIGEEPDESLEEAVWPDPSSPVR